MKKPAPKSTTPAKLPQVKTPDSKYSFFENVYAVARLIPKGRVTSYGAIAKYLGTAARSARLVGYAMNGAHGQKPPVPAHRVVNSSGLLTGRHHFNPPESMQQMLEAEGVKVKKHQVVDFDNLFWDPTRYLSI